MDNERKDLISRIGTFFLLMGVLLLVLFIASDIGKSLSCGYFLLGVVCILATIYLKRISATQAPPNTRFAAVRKLQQKQADARKKRDEAQKAKQGKK